MNILWYNSFSIGKLLFTVVFEKVNPLMHRLNYATSRVYLNGQLGHTWWYGTKSEVKEQIEIAKKIEYFLESFNNIHLTKEELKYLFDENGQFSKISHLFYFQHSDSLEYYIDSRNFRRTIHGYTDYHCLLGKDPQKQNFTIKINYDSDKDILDLSYVEFIDDKYNMGNKKISLPSFFSRCLTHAVIINILFDYMNGVALDEKPKLGSLISIPSKIGGFFGASYPYYKRYIDKYQLYEY